MKFRSGLVACCAAVAVLSGHALGEEENKSALDQITDSIKANADLVSKLKAEANELKTKKKSLESKLAQNQLFLDALSSESESGDGESALSLIKASLETQPDIVKQLRSDTDTLKKNIAEVEGDLNQIILLLTMTGNAPPPAEADGNTEAEVPASKPFPDGNDMQDRKLIGETEVETIDSDGVKTIKTTREYISAEEAKKREEEEEKTNAKSWFLGGGLAVRKNLSGDRVLEDAVTLATLPDGTYFAQIKESEEVDIRILLETHYMFDDISATNAFKAGKTVKGFSDLLACGLWSLTPLVTGNDESTGRRCGPFVGVAFDEAANPEEFAIGHMISFGEKGRTDSGGVFNLGYGLIIDPDSVTLDNALFEPGTLFIRDQYVDSLVNGTIDLTTKEETLGFMLLFSTNF